MQEDLDTRIDFAMLELSILLYKHSPLLFCRVLSELTKTGEMLVEFPGSILVTLHP